MLTLFSQEGKSNPVWRWAHFTLLFRPWPLQEGGIAIFTVYRYFPQIPYWKIQYHLYQCKIGWKITFESCSFSLCLVFLPHTPHCSLSLCEQASSTSSPLPPLTARQRLKLADRHNKVIDGKVDRLEQNNTESFQILPVWHGAEKCNL